LRKIAAKRAKNTQRGKRNDKVSAEVVEGRARGSEWAGAEEERGQRERAEEETKERRTEACWSG
jgi:hypothetical protein